VNDMMGQVVKPVEYINGVPQPPVVKRSSRTGEPANLNGADMEYLSGIKKSLLADALNINRFMNNTKIEEPASFYAPYDPDSVTPVTLPMRISRLKEAEQYSKQIPVLDKEGDWVEIFKHYIPHELTKLPHGTNIKINPEVNEEVLFFFEELGYNPRLIESARISYVTGSPTDSVFVKDDLIRLLESKIDITRIDFETYTANAPLGILYMNEEVHGNGVSMVSREVETKLFEYHSKRLDMMKVEDLLNIYTTEQDIQDYNFNVRALTPDELTIINNNNYRVMRAFDGSDRKNTLESHVGRRISGPTDLQYAIIDLKEQYNATGQI